MAVCPLNRRQLEVCRQIVAHLTQRGESVLLTDPRAIDGVAHVARHHKRFVRSPAQAVLVGSTGIERLRSLAAHLFERWTVPHWLDKAWERFDEQEQEWFIHLGAGKNLSTASDLPFPLTKRMAHFAVNAPRGLNSAQSLRWGQLAGLGTAKPLCRELVLTRLAHALPDEPFWRTVAGWFARHPEALGRSNAIVDYLYHQRIGDFAEPPQPHLSMRGRTPDRLIADARRWHAELNRARTIGKVPERWDSCGVSGFTPEPAPPGAPAAATLASLSTAADPGEPAPRPPWMIVEVTTYDELAAEGKALHHCVVSYVRAIVEGISAIFSLRVLSHEKYQPEITIELWPHDRRIVQARGLQNRRANGPQRKAIREWAKARGLKIEPGVFDDPWGHD